MCGLFGAIKLNRMNTISSNLVFKNGKEMETRGTHAVGWCQSIMNQHLEYEKFVGATSKHKRALKNALLDCSSLIGHTRHATHGSVNDEINNHPHLYATENVVGAVTHNGVIFNHENIAKRNGVKMEGECDSEIIARLLEIDDSKPLHERIADAVNACEDDDSIALAVLECDTLNNETNLCLVTRGNPIHYAIRNGVLYYASTPNKLPAGSVKLKENTIMQVTEKVGIVDSWHNMMKTYYEGINWNTYGSGFRGNGKASLPSNRNCQNSFSLDTEHDSFDDWCWSRSTERDRFTL